MCWDRLNFSSPTGSWHSVTASSAWQPRYWSLICVCPRSRQATIQPFCRRCGIAAETRGGAVLTAAIRDVVVDDDDLAVIPHINTPQERTQKRVAYRPARGH